MGTLRHKPQYLGHRKRWEKEPDDMHLLDDKIAGDVIITSLPPPGKCRILNVYWDPDLQKAIFEYEDEPV